MMPQIPWSPHLGGATWETPCWLINQLHRSLEDLPLLLDSMPHLVTRIMSPCPTLTSMCFVIWCGNCPTMQVSERGNTHYARITHEMVCMTNQIADDDILWQCLFTWQGVMWCGATIYSLGDQSQPQGIPEISSTLIWLNLIFALCDFSTEKGVVVCYVNRNELYCLYNTEFNTTTYISVQTSNTMSYFFL